MSCWNSETILGGHSSKLSWDKLGINRAEFSLLLFFSIFSFPLEHPLHNFIATIIVRCQKQIGGKRKNISGHKFTHNFFIDHFEKKMLSSCLWMGESEWTSEGMMMEIYVSSYMHAWWQSLDYTHNIMCVCIF